MSRFKYLLDLPKSYQSTEKLIGLFPFDTLVNKHSLDIRNGKLDFQNSSIEGLKILAQKGYGAILFINQFKTPISFEEFQRLNKVIENFVGSHGVNVHGIFWCPSTDKNDPYVVPNAGMFHRVTENQNINWKDILVVSTSNNDLSAASKVNATGIKIGSGPSKWDHFDTFFEWAVSL
jgi:histidinol phosphatase-like enzyme